MADTRECLFKIARLDFCHTGQKCPKAFQFLERGRYIRAAAESSVESSRAITAHYSIEAVAVQINKRSALLDACQFCVEHPADFGISLRAVVLWGE